jgi:carboxymethylenebutenolidase
MADVVNLNRFRKRKAQEEARRTADRNAFRHGRTREERELARAQEQLRAERLAAHRREAPPERCGARLPDGREATLEVFRPAASVPAPAVLVIHEWWGRNDDMRRIARRLADDGLLAAAVDLYDGAVTSDPAQARRLVETMTTPHAVEVVTAAAALLRADAGCDGRVGAVGFCLGGAMALATACHGRALDATIAFYGLPRPEYLQPAGAVPPIAMHFGLRDDAYARARVDDVAARLRAAGGDVELHWYDAGHAFLREGDPAAYDAASAAAAWPRVLDFLRQRLRPPPSGLRNGA